MKKIIPAMIVVSLLLVAQETGDEYHGPHEYVKTGIVFAMQGERINFDEMWLKTATPARNGQHCIITDASGQSVNLVDLHAPCRVELAYQEIGDTFIVFRISVLEQYHYDDKGFIRADQE